MVQRTVSHGGGLMNDRQQIERDIAMTFDFLRYVIDHPELADQIQDDSEIEFIGSDIITTTPAEDHGGDSIRTIIATKRSFEVLHTSQPSS